MAQGNQILIKPLNIDILEKGSYIVGFVEVVSRMRKVRHKAAVPVTAISSANIRAGRFFTAMVPMNMG